MIDKVKQDKIILDLIADKKISKDIKLFLIMRLLHEGRINLGKAYDLCESNGIFTQRWPMIEYEASEVIKRQYIFEGVRIQENQNAVES